MKFFTIILLIRHPDIDPDLITKHMGLEHYVRQKYGEDRFTPRGKPIGGKYSDSRWSHVWKFSHNQRMSEELKKIIGTINPNKKFIDDLVNSGAEIQLIINLPGSINHGFVVNSDVLRDLADIGIGLGFEVFPDWENEEGAHLKLV